MDKVPQEVVRSHILLDLPVGSDERLRLTANDMDPAGPPSSPEGWSFLLA